MLRVVVVGANGRMGKEIVKAVIQKEGVKLVGAVVRENTAWVGKDAGELVSLPMQDVVISDNLSSCLKAQSQCSDCIIDFSSPDYTLKNMAICKQMNLGMVIGTTAFREEDIQKIKQAAQQIPIVFAPNMSVGINLVLNLLKTTAKVLQGGVDISILEMHHRNKVDAPSGTALKMGEVIAEVTGHQLKTASKSGRSCGAREQGIVEFASIRAGDVVGEHSVIFVGSGERVEITHKASDRSIYAHGSLKAAEFIKNNAPGLYNMQDVLSLK